MLGDWVGRRVSLPSAHEPAARKFDPIVAQPDDRPLPHSDPDLERIVGEEQACLERVKQHLAERVERAPVRAPANYDDAMLDLRDQIASARLEDVPPLIEQMERLQSLANFRRGANGGGAVDPKSPYFAHLGLAEAGRQREVLIGRSTYVDTDSGIRIVDWRDAPVSRLYYRYQEGDSYDEVFGGREIHGEIRTRRSVTIVEADLRRVVAPQGSFSRAHSGEWRRLSSGAGKLTGGQGVALRAEEHHRPVRLGIGDEHLEEDKHLKEITALIDPGQFELITRPDSGLVVIQGGAGSGKTTIALHRLAYLGFLDPRRFRPDRVLVLVYNEALGRYMSLVLPALGVTGVVIDTYSDFAAGLREKHFSELPPGHAEDTPADVVRVKKHPAMLRAIDHWVADFEAVLEADLRAALGESGPRLALVEAWRSTAGQPTVHRLHALRAKSRSAEPGTEVRGAMERLVKVGLRRAGDVVAAWADLLGDARALARALVEDGVELSAELERTLLWIADRSSDLWLEVEEARDQPHTERGRDVPPAEPSDASAAGDAAEEDDEEDRSRGVDGRDVHEPHRLDREDDTLLLRFHQKLLGPLLRNGRGKEAMVYEHLVVDEAQDLSPVELAMALDTVSAGRSVTLAGDVAQRLNLDNGFSNWQSLLRDLGLEHIEVEPLRVSYRCTREIMEFSRFVLGPLAPPDPSVVPRSGAPVELFEFAHAGDSATFLGEALRELMQSEPRASVAVIARHPEQADLYFEALKQGEVPRVRRIAEQDFPFRPGVDVTDVRQVKGLEFDYVVLVEVSNASYPEEDEARYLLHIAATRAAHQLWVLTTGRPSRLLPRELMEQA
jgi:DNA helicase II / ATP-dependent DNA helicase PcrA